MTSHLTVSWAVEVVAWTVALRAAGRPETTIRTRTEHLRWLGKVYPDVSPWDLTLDDLTTWVGGKVWARETRRAVRSSLRGFYAWGVATGRVAVSVAAGLPSVPPSRPNPHPTPDSAFRLSLADAGPRERLMIRLAAECGMRRAEVAQVHSRDLVEDLGGWSLIVHGKGARDRLVPLPSILAHELRERPPGWVFPGDDGGHLSPRWVGKLVGRLLPDGYTMHSLRHRAATRWYGVNHDLLTVGDLLGHASPVTTRLYVRVPDEARRALVVAGAA